MLGIDAKHCLLPLCQVLAKETSLKEFNVENLIIDKAGLVVLDVLSGLGLNLAASTFMALEALR